MKKVALLTILMLLIVGGLFLFAKSFGLMGIVLRATRTEVVTEDVCFDYVYEGLGALPDNPLLLCYYINDKLHGTNLCNKWDRVRYCISNPDFIEGENKVRIVGFHTAYCSNWIEDYGSGEILCEKILSRKNPFDGTVYITKTVPKEIVIARPEHGDKMCIETTLGHEDVYTYEEYLITDVTAFAMVEAEANKKEPEWVLTEVCKEKCVEGECIYAVKEVSLPAEELVEAQPIGTPDAPPKSVEEGRIPIEDGAPPKSLWDKVATYYKENKLFVIALIIMGCLLIYNVVRPKD